MMSRPTRTALIVLGLALIPILAMAQDINWISNISKNREQYWNRQVALQGQVTNVHEDSLGVSRGTFILVDESDPQGIRVVSHDLPAPGKAYKVWGTITQSRLYPGEMVLMESRRSAIQDSSRLRTIIIAAGGVAVVLFLALIVTLIRSRRDVQHSWRQVPSISPVPHTHPAPVPSPAAPQPQVATMPFTPRTTQPHPTSPGTETFQYFGKRLEVIEGPDVGKRYQVGASPFYIGRDGGRRNHVTLSDPTVSTAQATLRREEHNGHFSLINDSRTNKTMVDNNPVDAVQLMDGSRIRMGSTVLVLAKDE